MGQWEVLDEWRGKMLGEREGTGMGGARERFSVVGGLLQAEARSG